jgi:putative inorganic carbon (HCO3(-)) transporter
LGVILGVGAIRDYFLFRPSQLFTTFNIKVNIASYLTLLMPLSFVVFFSKTKKVFKYLSVVSIVLLIPMFIFHASRGVWIAVLISLAVVSLFAQNKYKVIFYSLVIIGLIFMPNLYKERAKTILDPFSQSSVIERAELFTSAVNIFKAHPIFGAGLGMFGKLFKNGSGQHLHAHNIYLEIAAEMGIVGLLAFLSIMIIFFKKFIINLFEWAKTGGTVKIISIAAGASIFASLISNLSTSSILVGFYDPLVFWLLLAIAVNDNIPKVT